MKFIKWYMVLLLFSVLLIFGLEKNVDNISLSQSGKDEIKQYNNDWRILENNQWVFQQELPFKVKDTETVVISKILPEELSGNESIGFYTSHTSVDVYVGDVCVYTHGVSSKSKSKTPGNAWNFIHLKNTYVNQKIVIAIKDVYSTGYVNIPNIMFGEKDNMVSKKFRDTIWSSVVSILMLLLGFTMLLAYVFLRKKIHMEAYYVWLGMFSIVLSIWSLFETKLPILLYGNDLVISQIAFVTLKLVFIPIMMFISSVYNSKENKLIHILCICSGADLVITSLLQMMGIYDFKETLIFTHILFSIAAVLGIVYAAKEMYHLRYQSVKEGKLQTINVICIPLLIGSIIIDLLRYICIDTIDSALFSRITLWFYICVLAVCCVDNSIRLMKAGEEAEQLKECALKDALTKLYNRMAYEKDIVELVPEEHENLAVVMCDLNNLKHYNDVYGHSMGDYYIVLASEVIQDVLGVYGKVYRIGGDEFCAILFEAGIKECEKCRKEINIKLESICEQDFAGLMQIAMGYAVYKKEDQNISDIIKRADAAMYECKQSMKNEKSDKKV